MGEVGEKSWELSHVHCHEDMAKSLGFTKWCNGDSLNHLYLVPPLALVVYVHLSALYINHQVYKHAYIIIHMLNTLLQI